MRSKTESPADADEQTVQLARKKFARRQWTRRWLTWRPLAAVVLLLVMLGGVVWFVFFSSALAVSDVEVAGTSVLTTDRVRTAAAVPSGEPLATVDLKAIAARVEALAPVKDVDVSRSWPNSVRIDIHERAPVAVVVAGGVVRGMDDQGVLFREYAAAPAGLPVVHMSLSTRTEALAEAALVVGSLPASLAAKVDYVDVATIDTISLRMHDDRTIMWGSAEDSVDKAKVIAVLLEAAPKATTYDVSVPGQPTTKQ